MKSLKTFGSNVAANVVASLATAGLTALWVAALAWAATKGGDRVDMPKWAIALTVHCRESARRFDQGPEARSRGAGAGLSPT